MKYSKHLAVICLLLFGFGRMVRADTITQTSYSFTSITVPGSTAINAYGINNSGQIVGTYTDSSGTHGFLNSGGRFTPLSFTPTGINNSGQIAGFSNNSIVVDTNGTITSIALPGFGSFLSESLGEPIIRINDLGQIAASYRDTQFLPRAFIFGNGTFTFLPIPADSTVIPKSINNAGQLLVTGIFGAGNPNAYIYANGTYSPVDNTGGYAVGVNNRGEIVTTQPPGIRAYQNGVYAGGFIASRFGIASDLNDAGQILFVNAVATPVPEPASLLLIACGLASVFVLRPSRR